MQEFKQAFDILKNIYLKGAYSDIELKKAELKGNKELIYKMILGTIENNFQLDYDIEPYINKDKPKDDEIIIAVKLAIYCIKYLNSTPDYAVVNEANLIFANEKNKWKKPVVNAILRNYLRSDKKIEFKNKYHELSYKYSLPIWYIKKLLEQIDENTFINMFENKNIEEEQIRVNKRLYSEKEFIDFLNKNEIEYKKGIAGEFIVKNNKLFKTLFREGKITYQSGSSMLCVHALDLKDNLNILDLCAAPGGKTIYISEFFDNLKITSCDIHEHRVELINSYKERMKALNISTSVLDAKEFKPEYRNSFDRILVDAPCTGSGVINKKSDILLKMTNDKISSIVVEQKNILQNSLKYLKKNGVLVYSTCSILKEENEEVIKSVLRGNINFKLEKINIDYENNGYLTLYPSDKIKDGFFIAKIRRIF